MEINYEYDLAISFAGEDREIVRELVSILSIKGVDIFYDENEQASLWGKDLYQYLQNIYRDKARYCVIFISENYANKYWTKHELRQAQERAFLESEEYILPLRLDDAEIPGLNSTVAYMDLRVDSILEVSNVIIDKLKNINQKIKFIPPVSLKHSEGELTKIENEINESTVETYYERAKNYYNNGRREQALQELIVIINKYPIYYARTDIELSLQDEKVKEKLSILYEEKRNNFYKKLDQRIEFLKNKYINVIDKDSFENYLNSKKDIGYLQIKKLPFIHLNEVEKWPFEILDLNWETQETLNKKEEDKEIIEGENRLKTLREQRVKKNEHIEYIYFLFKFSFFLFFLFFCCFLSSGILACQITFIVKTSLLLNKSYILV